MKKFLTALLPIIPLLLSNCNKEEPVASTAPPLISDSEKHRNLYENTTISLIHEPTQAIAIHDWLSWLGKHMHTPAFPNEKFKDQTVIVFSPTENKDAIIQYPKAGEVTLNEYINTGAKAFGLKVLHYEHYGVVFLVDEKIAHLFEIEKTRAYHLGHKYPFDIEGEVSIRKLADTCSMFLEDSGDSNRIKYRRNNEESEQFQQHKIRFRYINPDLSKILTVLHSSKHMLVTSAPAKKKKAQP